MQVAEKTLNYYLALPYTIEIVPDIKHGGYVAWIKELEGCITQADSWSDLLPMIEDAKRGWLEVSIENGDVIPEPESNNK